MAPIGSHVYPAYGSRVPDPGSRVPDEGSGSRVPLFWYAPKACNFIKKETLAQVFFCEFCEIFKNTFFTEHLRTTASRFGDVNNEKNLSGETKNIFLSFKSAVFLEQNKKNLLNITFKDVCFVLSFGRIKCH